MQYMKEICDDLDKIPVKKYCQDKALNLILSSYLEKATEQNIQTIVSVTATDFSRFQIPDLCSLWQMHWKMRSIPVQRSPIQTPVISG